MKEYDRKDDVGWLHFHKWTDKFDYRGSLRQLYLARRGTFSDKQGISDANHYPLIIKDDKKKKKKRSSTSPLTVSGPSFHLRTSPPVESEPDPNPPEPFPDPIPVATESLPEAEVVGDSTRKSARKVESVVKKSDDFFWDDEAFKRRRPSGPAPSERERPVKKLRPLPPPPPEDSVPVVQTSEEPEGEAETLAQLLARVGRAADSRGATDRALQLLTLSPFSADIKVKQIRDILKARRCLETVLDELLKQT